MADWFLQVEKAGRADARGRVEQVDFVLDVSFEFFKANPDFVRMVRREALDSQNHLGIDIGAVAAAAVRPGRRLLRARDGQRHASDGTTPSNSSSPGTARC